MSAPAAGAAANAPLVAGPGAAAGASEAATIEAEAATATSAAQAIFFISISPGSLSTGVLLGRSPKPAHKKHQLGDGALEEEERSTGRRGAVYSGGIGAGEGGVVCRALRSGGHGRGWRGAAPRFVGRVSGHERTSGGRRLAPAEIRVPLASLVSVRMAGH